MWEIGAQIRYGINNSLFQPTIKNCWVKRTFRSVLQTLPHPWLTHLDTAYQSSRFVCHHLSLSLQRDSSPQTLIVRKRTLNYLAKFNQLASLAKWLSVCLRTTWLWVRILLQSSRLLWARSSLTFRQLQSAASCSHLNYRVQIHSKMHMWHDKNTQSPCHPCYIFECV